MKTQSCSPWLDQNGKTLPTEKIKLISKDWDSETWESFLKSTVDAEASGYEVTTPKYESLCEDQQDTMWGSSEALPQAVQEEVRSAVRKLKERPKKIIRCHYWENLSVREIGKIEDLSFGRVQQIKNESLNEIKGLLENALHTPSYLIGGYEDFNPSENREQEIKEVYRTDLEGSYLK